jgi:hypothetical protein
MDRKKIILTISILTLMLLAFSVQSAYCATDTTSAGAAAYAQSQASTFLKQVAGFDMTNYTIISFNTTTPAMLNSQTPQTIVSAIVSDGRQNYSLAMALVQGKVWFYDLTPLTSISVNTQMSIDNRLGLASKAIDQYQLLFNASYCSGFAQLVPASVTVQNVTISSANTNTLLNINSDTSTAKSESTSFSWFKPVDGAVIPQMSTTMIISNTGLVTSFYDNLAVYNIANVKASVSKEAAITIAKPYIEKYANDNSQTVNSIDVTLTYTVDANASRGDGNTIYPQWQVFAQLDGSNQFNITQYAVMIWADNGVAYHYGPQGNYQTITTNTSSFALYPVIVTVALVAAAGTILHMRHRIKIQQPKTRTKFNLKLGGTLIIVCLLSISMIQSCSATTSTIYGSRYNVPSDEQTADVTLTNAIASYSSSRGYATYNLYGSSTTASNIYIGAYGNGDSFSIAFYVGHGGHSVEWHYWGWPWQWHTHDYLSITADDGSTVRDNDIWQNSFYQSINAQKVAMLWSCHSGEDAMGSWITYPCGDTQEHGMPYAWNHITSMSFDGYTSSDSSGQVFIGFTGVAPFLSYDGFGMADAGLVFLYHFYYAALVYHWTVHDSLDFASQSVWGVNYGSCTFKSGFTTPDGPGQMVVYGQGTRYM